MRYCHPDSHDCGLGAQEGLELKAPGCSPSGPEPLALWEEGPRSSVGNCRWESQAGIVLISSHLKLPEGVGGRSHRHPLGQDLVLHGPFGSCRISEMGGYPSWWRR